MTKNHVNLDTITKISETGKLKMEEVNNLLHRRNTLQKQMEAVDAEIEEVILRRNGKGTSDVVQELKQHYKFVANFGRGEEQGQAEENLARIRKLRANFVLLKVVYKAEDVTFTFASPNDSKVKFSVPLIWFEDLSSFKQSTFRQLRNYFHIEVNKRDMMEAAKRTRWHLNNLGFSNAVEFDLRPGTPLSEEKYLDFAVGGSDYPFSVMDEVFNTSYYDGRHLTKETVEEFFIMPLSWRLQAAEKGSEEWNITLRWRDLFREIIEVTAVVKSEEEQDGQEGQEEQGC